MHVIGRKKKVIVGISGGVDSAVAAWILKQQGYVVESVFMKNWTEPINRGNCSSSVIDLEYAESICDHLNIKLYLLDFSLEYWEKVFKKFIFGLKNGYTPNPDIMCNKEIKFGIFLKYAFENLDADYIATGHYARNINILPSTFNLIKGIDQNKDQSYFLYTITNKTLSKVLFPLGWTKKSTVRYLARINNFINHDKKDSTGICFIGQKKFSSFIRKYLPENPGDIIDNNGMVLGKHKGLAYYTLGQRKGIGIGGIKLKRSSPWYVISKDTKNNTLIVSQGKNNIKLMSIGLFAKHVNWINPKQNIYNNMYCKSKIRYRQNDISCNITYMSNKHVKVIFIKPVVAVTPGQSIVFYKNDICLGGGIIDSRIPYNK